jgi:hypothetical protein
MLPGFTGHLLSESFLEDKLTGDGTTIDRDAWRQFADARRRGQALGPASSLRAMLGEGAAPLARVMGFAAPRDVALDRTVLVATLDAGNEPVVLIVAGWCEPLELSWRAGLTHAALRSSRWCALYNGITLRLMDGARPHSRRYAQFDLDTVADDERAFAAFSLVLGRFPSTLETLVRESDRHGAGVCRSLKDGVLSASADVLSALVRAARARKIVPTDSFEQALTIVYRILFLLFAESRRLVPLWHPVYRDSYSIEALSTLAERPDARGLWDALRAIARLAHAGCRAGDLHVTPFNGRLFAPGRTPLAERRDLDDESARRALVALSTRPAAHDAGRERIAYRDLGVEQLGAVYETLLDYQPRMTRNDVSLATGAGVRKSTGTFYTPQPIPDYLVRRTLSPLVDEREPHHILELRIVDPAMGSGAFLVAACRYLAQAYESALLRFGVCHPGDIGDDERAAIRRTIAERCLYGVDLNPMAVQLARLSLWLATLSADRPLTFLDHRLQIGDSLLGAWLDCLRRAPARPRQSTRRDAGTFELFDRAALHGALAEALPLRFSIESISGDTIASVRDKEAALAKLKQPDAALSRWRRIADAWCASWFTTGEACVVPPEAFLSLCDWILAGHSALPAQLARKYLELAADVASARRFFHWELEFPEVFFDAGGNRRPLAGFDAVIGNPPWDMIRADAGSTNVRQEARASNAPVLRFTRDSGVYVTQSAGHANRYQLFAERALALVRHGGRIGLVLPSGLATDQGSGALRRRLLTECAVDAIVGLDNHRGVFPIHRSVKFLLVSATTGSRTSTIGCRLGELDPAALEADDGGPPARSTWFPVRITQDLIHRLSGDSLVIPDLRTASDVAIAERAAALFPPLGSEAGWSVRFGRELNATDDRHAFERAGVGDLPVMEGKHLEPFRARLDATERSISTSKARRLLDSKRYERPRLAYRDVAGSTNRLTLIAAILPARCVSTHTLFCLRSPLPLTSQYFLCGLFNSFIVNYLVRMRVTTHVTTATVERLPIPPPGYSSAEREIAALARLLSRRENPEAFARLQALAARVYQLTKDEFRHVLDTFPLIPKEIKDAAYDTYVATEALRTLR